jgi:flagellar biosynthesis/type III secretory pathway chaperone
MEKQLLAIMTDLQDKNLVLLTLFREERQCLIDNDLVKLQNVALREMELGLQISALEKRRQVVVKAIKDEHKIVSENITIRDICAVVGAPSDAQLLRAGRDLKGLLNDIMDVRILNNKLIQKMLAFNERNIKLFMNFGNKKLTYDLNGKIQHSRRQMLDSVV